MKRFLSFRWLVVALVSAIMGLTHWNDGMPWNAIWIALPFVLGAAMEVTIFCRERKRDKTEKLYEKIERNISQVGLTCFRPDGCKKSFKELMEEISESWESYGDDVKDFLAHFFTGEADHQKFQNFAGSFQ